MDLFMTMFYDALRLCRELFAPIFDFSSTMLRLAGSLAWVSILYFVAFRYSDKFANFIRTDAPPSIEFVHVILGAIVSGAITLSGIVAIYGFNRRQRRLERLGSAVERSLSFFYSNGRSGSIADHFKEDEPLFRYYDRIRGALFDLKANISPKSCDALRDVVHGRGSQEVLQVDKLLASDLSTIIYLSEPNFEYGFNVLYAWSVITLPIIFALTGLVIPKICNSYLALSIASLTAVYAVMTCVRLSDDRL